MTDQNFFPKIKCLLVDDLPENLLALEALLKDMNLQIFKALSGTEALELSLQHDFALALIDVQMPGMTGFELAEFLRGSERTKPIPLIFVTAGMRDQEGVFRGYEAGAVDFLYKPIDPHILRSKVKIFVELAQQKEKLRRQEELFRTTFENAAVGLARANMQGKWIQMNPQYCELLGLCESDFESCNEAKLTHPEDFEKESDLRRQLLEGKLANFTFEKRMYKKNGEMIWVKTQTALIQNGESDSAFFISSAQNITAEKEAAESLKKSKRASDEAARTKSEFLANMSHEIRTPLTAILGFTNILLEDSFPEAEVKHFLERIKRNGDSLLHLIEDILDLSKFESGKIPVDPVATNIQELLDEVLGTFENMVQRKGLVLKLQWETPLTETLWMDRLRVRQVLVNLISNAVKFTEKGSVTIRSSTVQTEDGGRRVQFIVEDSGVGISSDQQEKIFKPFTQADASITRKFGGTGLGLTLSKRIAQAMNGDLVLAWSEPGKGSAFRFDFLTGKPSPTA